MNRNIIVLCCILLLIFTGCVKTSFSINDKAFNQKIYFSKKYNIALKYPKTWNVNRKYTPEKYEGKDGFFQIDATSGENLTIDEVTKNQAKHKLKPYGENPQIESMKIKDQEARLIVPSSDQSQDMKSQAALIIAYPTPIQIDNETYRYGILYADKQHITALASTIQFVK